MSINHENRLQFLIVWYSRSVPGWRWSWSRMPPKDLTLTSPCELLVIPTKCRYIYETISSSSRWTCGAELRHFPSQQAQEMVQEILRERDHGGFNERNDFGSHIGGGIDVSLCLGAGLSLNCHWTKSICLNVANVVHLDPGAATLSWRGHWPQWRDDQKNPEWCWS